MTMDGEDAVDDDSKKKEPRPFAVGDKITVLRDGKPIGLRTVASVRKFKINTKVTDSKGDEWNKVGFLYTYRWSPHSSQIRHTKPGDADYIRLWSRWTADRETFDRSPRRCFSCLRYLKRAK